MKKVLVLGGDGFVGSHLSKSLEINGYDFLSISRKTGVDLRVYSQVRDLIDDCKPDAIVNCAAHVGSLHYVTQYAADVIHDNVLMATNIYKSLAETKCECRIINPLSNCSYPGEANLHIETDWWNGEVHDSVFAYGNAKRFIYVLSKCYLKQYGIKTTNFLIPNTFGPGDYSDPNKVHALNGMIIRMIEAFKKSDPKFVIWGSGKPIREWAYIEDVVNILIRGIELDCELTYPVNLAQNKGYSIKESALLIAQAIGFKGELVFNTQYQDGAPFKILDDKLFRRYFPDFVFFDHQAGIIKTVEYYEMVL